MSKRRPAGSYETSRRVQRAFGARLKQVRERKGGLQKILAGQLALSRTSISNIERGTHRVFLDQVYTAANALGVEVIELLPPVSEIFGDLGVHTAPDDPLPDAAVMNARDVAHSVRMDLVERTGSRRPSRTPAGRRR